MGQARPPRRVDRAHLRGGRPRAVSTIHAPAPGHRRSPSRSGPGPVPAARWSPRSGKGGGRLAKAGHAHPPALAVRHPPDGVAARPAEMRADHRRDGRTGARRLDRVAAAPQDGGPCLAGKRLGAVTMPRPGGASAISRTVIVVPCAAAGSHRTRRQSHGGAPPATAQAVESDRLCTMAAEIPARCRSFPAGLFAREGWARDHGTSEPEPHAWFPMPGAAAGAAESASPDDQTSARMRAGPPVPPRCLGAPTNSVAPVTGRSSRLFRHSMP